MAIINFVKDYERIAVFKWGKFQGMRGPGLVVLVPFMHSGRQVHTQIQVRDIPRQRNITKDNAAIDIDFLVYMRVDIEEAQKAVLEVSNYKAAVIGLATTTLRAVIGDIPLDDVLSQRERINELIRTRLDSETARWGIKVTNVEIREIEPPRDIQDSMNRQMTAERVRRAVVTEAEGTRESSITVAEGARQATILAAEGDRQADILAAEGARQASILRAEGFAEALNTVYGVAQNVDQKTMSLQYFETLKEMGEGAATKFIFPMEFTSMLQSFVGSAARQQSDDAQ